MRVETVLRSKGVEVHTIDPDRSVRLALAELRTHEIGALVVTEDGAHVLGLFTERDVVRGVSRHEGAFLHNRVGDEMSTGVPVCGPDDHLPDVMELMTRTRFRHIPVVDDGSLCGLISIGDVVKARLQELELEAQVLRDAYLARG